MTSRRRGRMAVAGLLAAVALAGCGGGEPGPAPGPEVVDLVVDGEPATAVVPPGTPRGLVLYLHGLNGDHTALANGDQAGVVERLVDDGYVVAAADAHRNAFGNEASQQSYVTLAQELTDRYGTPRTFLIAESMGAVAGLKLVAADAIPDLAGAALISPLTDLAVTVGSEFEPQVRQAYGGELPIGAENPADLPAEEFAGEHLRFYLAADDDFVVSAQNADPLIARLEGVAEVSVVGCQGGHVDASCFQPDDLATWFDGLAGGTTGAGRPSAD
ncbi:alpha/beta hydrolase [Modestobacter roseus]|uniref:alpha/beta hydrolase n=1 Tax=Modestobacter roseus TaxID=1181884 RepID=UPI0034DE17DC